VAMTVVLFPVSAEEPKLRPVTLEELARLGVTSVALLRDAALAGLVLEGWAFRPRDACAAARAVAGSRGGLRMLQPVAQMAVSTVRDGGGLR
jgi:hypothetical protein